MENSPEIKEQLIKNGFWNIITSLINRGGSFVLVILLSRLLMPEGFGNYSLAMTIATLFITFSDLGINQTLIKYVSSEIDKDNQKAVAYFRYLFKIRFLLTLSASLILLLGAYPLSNYIFHNPSLFLNLVILSFYVFILSITSFFESLFFIKKNVKYFSIKESISLILKIIAIIAILYFIVPGNNLVYIFFSFLGIAFLTFFLDLYFSKRSYPSLFKKTKSNINKRGISKFILLLNIQNISLAVLSQANIILLGILLTEEYVGYYNASWALVAGLISLLFSFSYIFLPIFTSLPAEAFQYVLKKLFNLFFILSLPISFGLSLLSKFLIVAIYGRDYLPASVSLSILAFIIPCMIGVDLALTSFSARGKQKKAAIIMFISALIFLVLNYLFMKFLSGSSGESILRGISIVNLASWVFCFLCMVYLLRKELDINVISSQVIKSFFSCSVMLGFILFSLYFFKDMNLFNGIIIIISSAILYFSLMFLIGGIKKDEIKELLKFKNSS